jgi:diguanylate cyclase (GGDEF)-like protein
MNAHVFFKSIGVFGLIILFSNLTFADDFLSQERLLNSFKVPLFKINKQAVVYPIDPKILSLYELSAHDSVNAQAKLQQLQQMTLTLNQAEHYLMYVVLANLANVAGQENTVINWLKKAITLEPSLNEEQLNSPNFANAHLILANVYQQQGTYQKAFDSKKAYIKKYSDHLASQNKLRIEGLNEKHHMKTKYEENQLLGQSSELRSLELLQAESQRKRQNINITIIIFTGLLFFFLLLRQFRIRRALKILIKTDSLTQLINRKTFFKNGYRYMEHTLEEQSELCVIMVDIDNFKQLNDKFGYDVGDKVIVLVARLGSEAMRSRDILARIDGEEFAAILPDTNIGQARAIAGRIREKIQDSVDKELNELSISVSIGLASSEDDIGNFDHLFHAAEVATRQAKKQGGNGVCNYLSTHQD